MQAEREDETVHDNAAQCSRQETMMGTYDNHPLTQAARNTDAIAEEHGMEKACEMMEIDIDAITHVADQRALRLVMLATKGPKAVAAMARSNKPMAVPMNPDERNLHRMFQIAILNGIAIGWRGRDIDKGDNKK